MPPQEEDLGVDAIDRSIEQLELKLETLKEVQDILYDLEEDDDVKLSVIDEENSHVIEVIISADEPIDNMRAIANTDSGLKGDAFNPDDIIYDYEDETYRLKTTFNINR